MKVLKKEMLADTPETRIVALTIESSAIAQKALAGQFVVIMVSEKGERLPLTVVDTDTGKGTITLIAQEAGLTTKLLGRLESGDSLHAIAGPLGHATPIKKYARVILAGGGVGIAEIYPVARAMKEAGNHVTTILGARTKEALILEKELTDLSDELHITTDDGSSGRKGFVTDILKELLDSGQERTAKSQEPNRAIALVYAVGPIPMMEKVSAVTKESGVKTLVSLNALMVDGTGMCGCCRVTVGGKTQFVCIDGPEFDAHLVDWKELQQRNSVYQDKEKHICKLNEQMRQ